jgi:predicted metal-dependent peptidase
MTNKLTAEQRVQKAHVALMNNPKYCLYSGVLMLGTTMVDDDVPTAYTDGRTTKYGRKFIDKLDDKELKGLILHENLHKAFRHMTIWDDLWKENARLANMACDYVINLMIVDSDKNGTDVCLPEGGCYDEKYRGMDAGTVFRLLKQDQGQRNGKGNGSGDAGSQESQGFDEHGWEEAQELSTEEKESIAREVDQALRQGAILAGKLGGNLPREIGDVLESKTDWREALREFVNSFCLDKDVSTWRKPNRRWVDHDVYLPSLIGESVGRIVVGVDTSGSIGVRQIGEFLGEIKRICETVCPEGIDLLYWDSRVCAHEKYEEGNYDALLQTTKPAGGGGTSPQCVANYMNERKMKAECVIMLTDGYVDNWGDGWTAPVLWAITTKDVTALTGRTIHIKN